MKACAGYLWTCNCNEPIRKDVVVWLSFELAERMTEAMNISTECVCHMINQVTRVNTLTAETTEKWTYLQKKFLKIQNDHKLNVYNNVGESFYLEAQIFKMNIYGFFPRAIKFPRTIAPFAESFCNINFKRNSLLYSLVRG